MINLLPDAVKQNITYARRNTMLRHWIGVFIISIVGIGVITVFGLFYINQNINTYTTQNAQAAQDLQNQHLDSTQKQVLDISNNLKLTVQVLSREVLFSSLIKQIATAIPQKAILTNLEISKIEGGIDLGFSATDYNTSTQIQVNLQDPANKIFDKADINSIVCSTKNSAANALAKSYPCVVTIRAQFAKSNPYLFINVGEKK
ncbi:MAG: hypothetical protein ACXWLH_00570 [Candidatus Saccharimonadales bacterium]